MGPKKYQRVVILGSSRKVISIMYLEIQPTDSVQTVSMIMISEYRELFKTYVRTARVEYKTKNNAQLV